MVCGRTKRYDRTNELFCDTSLYTSCVFGKYVIQLIRNMYQLFLAINMMKNKIKDLFTTIFKKVVDMIVLFDP